MPAYDEMEEFSDLGEVPSTNGTLVEAGVIRRGHGGGDHDDDDHEDHEYREDHEDDEGDKYHEDDEGTPSYGHSTPSMHEGEMWAWESFDDFWMHNQEYMQSIIDKFSPEENNYWERKLIW